MITQEDIYFFFENIAEEFRNQNIPILNNIMHDFKNYPYRENLEVIDEQEQSEDEEDLYDSETS